MRHVGDRLHDALEARGAHFVQQERQDDGRGETEHQRGQADGERVAQEPAEIVRLKEADEVRKAVVVRPGAAPGCRAWGRNP